MIARGGRIRRPVATPRALLCLCALALAGAARAQPNACAAGPGWSDPALERSLAAEVASYVQADRLSAPPACEVLFVGSSSIVKWRPTLAADMAPMPVIDRGFGGSHIEYVNRWFNSIVAPYRPRAIVFYAGENDLDAGKPVERVVADFDTFMALKTRALGETPVYFISLKPSKRRFAQLRKQSEVNEAVRRRAGERTDLHYIDVVTPMLENGRPRDIFEADGLHMTASGYAIWTRLVRAALLPATQAEARRCRAPRPGPGPDAATAAPVESRPD